MRASAPVYGLRLVLTQYSSRTNSAGGIEFLISPEAFFQTTTEMAEVLYLSVRTVEAHVARLGPASATSLETSPWRKATRSSPSRQSRRSPLPHRRAIASANSR